jgi:3,4-dihydroxy 2-butanone 4-phosphate synthase/GTP cyclohydrolase II
VVVILCYGESPRQLVEAARTLSGPKVTELSTGGGVATLRTYGTGAQILRKLGVTRMRVLSAPKQMHAISGFGLEVVEYLDSSD